ncbi:hypothetical protein HMPREF0658_2103 [Hoylesella marshii DSM 16973 = JCM 13450]|uniref:Uncharacterized protein n=1 Tax=Hoylesella marshii DSM 16973 = JCM 13450 TaxID=862515 RepID=E0NV98_9BACT|nr:hypothetical protein HMPREF0658_2103 [Hoylesella marshii DSM 16973 = JCM 13450]
MHYRLPLPVFCRTYSAPFCCDFSPLRSYWIRFSYLKLAYKLLDYTQRVVRVAMTRTTRFVFVWTMCR